MTALILSTCGTSLLTNNISPEDRPLVYKHANATNLMVIPDTEREKLEDVVNRMPRILQNASIEELSRHSAELNGILRYYGGQFNAGQGDVHWLIATKTWLGEKTACILGDVLRLQGYDAQVKTVQDLRTDSLEEFRIGMSELAKICAQELKGYRERRYRVIFNLTGGFKSIQGFMQALGMLYADESVYVFESTHELLRLPKLPFSMDVLGQARQYERIFRRYRVGFSLSEEDARGVPEAFLMRIGEGITLSVWAETVWAEAEKDVLSENLLPPIDAKLRYSNRFPGTVNTTCSPEEKHQINERLAELARHLNNPVFNPNRLDFKMLRVPRDRWTHECDAWANGAAKRLFGYFDGGTYVVDALAPKLH
jgi:putative CRISPR-associated protein (TIGR02619 family)